MHFFASDDSRIAKMDLGSHRLGIAGAERQTSTPAAMLFPIDHRRGASGAANRRMTPPSPIAEPTALAALREHLGVSKEALR